MREKFLPAAVAWLAAMSMGVQAADPPGVTVLGPPTVAPTPAAPSVYEVPVGRFIPFVPLSGGPVYLEENRAYRVYVVKPGERWTGIKYDAPADAENEPWTAPADSKGPVYILLARGYLGSYSVQPVKNGKTLADAPEKDGAPLKIQIVSGKGPKPPPDIDPKPDDPKPVPVTSFRVILVHESAQNLPPAQNSILYGKDVRDYLTAKTTPENGVAGWRLYDKDTDAANDQSAIAAMWKAVKPKVTTVPAMAVEVNGKVEIVPLPATAPEALTALKKYRGE